MRCGEGRVKLIKKCLGRWIEGVAYFMGAIGWVDKRYRNTLQKILLPQNLLNFWKVQFAQKGIFFFFPFKWKENKHFLEIKFFIKVTAICKSIIFHILYSSTWLWIQSTWSCLNFFLRGLYRFSPANAFLLCLVFPSS